MAGIINEAYCPKTCFAYTNSSNSKSQSGGQTLQGYLLLKSCKGF